MRGFGGVSLGHNSARLPHFLSFLFFSATMCGFFDADPDIGFLAFVTPFPPAPATFRAFLAPDWHSDYRRGLHLMNPQDFFDYSPGHGSPLHG